MTTITLFSDLHLEFDPAFRPRNPGSDILILAGDVCCASYFRRGEDSPYSKLAIQFRDFFKHCSDSWEHILYVNGNHEHYKGRFDLTTQILKEELAQYGNINHLDNESTTLKGWNFIGATLWTNVNSLNPITESMIKSRMNDYHVIQVKDGSIYRKLNPYDTFMEHKKSLEFIESSLWPEKNFIISHMHPSTLSIHPKYNNDRDYHINYAYVSDLSEFIFTHELDYWVAGHVHDSFDYTLGDTRILCNSKGYNGENPIFNEGMILELD